MKGNMSRNPKKELVNYLYFIMYYVESEMNMIFICKYSYVFYLIFPLRNKIELLILLAGMEIVKEFEIKIFTILYLSKSLKSKKCLLDNVCMCETKMLSSSLNK